MKRGSKWIVGVTLAGLTATGGTFAADRAQNPYIDEGTHYKLDIVSDIPQGERVEIAKDRAAMTLKGWNDEYAITIEPQIPSALLGAAERRSTTPANRPLLSKTMEFKSGDVTAFIEPKSANEFDIDFTLDSKPDTNVFEYNIDGAEEFNFFYQPELTAEEIAEGAERPENVVGSYAVYHKTKANHRVGSTNYATGKAFHIYRPKAIDANGAEVWAELSYEDGILSVTIDDKWLSQAVYPVVVDPTFGYHAVGATTQKIAAKVGGGSCVNSRTYAASTSTAPTSFTPTSLSFYFGDFPATDTITIMGGIHNAADVLLATSTQVDITAIGWATSTISLAEQTAADYWLGVMGDSTDVDCPPTSNGIGISYDAGGTTQAENDIQSVFLLPDPLAGTVVARQYSIYATYTADAPAATGWDTASTTIQGGGSIIIQGGGTLQLR